MDHYAKAVISQLRTLKDSFTKVFHLLSKKQKRTYAISMLFMFLSSLLELFTIGLLVPFLGMIVSPGSWTETPLDRIVSFPVPLSPVLRDHYYFRNSYFFIIHGQELHKLSFVFLLQSIRVLIIDRSGGKQITPLLFFTHS